MVHSACTIHLLNMPEKTAKRDIIHGVKHLEEIAEDWLCARRTLSIISVLARKWNCELPEEAAAVLRRTDEKYGYLGTQEVPSPSRPVVLPYTPSPPAYPSSPAQAPKQEQHSPSVQQQVAATTMGMGQEVPTSLAPDMLSNLGSIAPPSIPDQPVSTSMAGNPSNTSTMSYNSSWSMPGMSTPAMPRYHQSYAPIQMSTSGPPPQGSRTMTRQVTPNSIYAIDGQDWFLKDGLNWQQNFESWGLGASPTNSSSNASGGGGGGAGMTSSEMFMFKGLQGPGLDMGSSWDFDSSMSNLDQIPGLD